ncbi:hypothetical protein [Streptomyces sp. NPDC007905]|uniref:hypothetical protein n=1 Tax=Streptomyces sp. NPDC007905 TaxID=3364788 RepID=UPI0036E4C1D5
MGLFATDPARIFCGIVSGRVRASRVYADRARPDTAQHPASMPAIAVLDLDLAAALAVARQETWATAHSQYAAQPTPDRPDGAIIATTAPHRCAGRRGRPRSQPTARHRP